MKRREIIEKLEEVSGWLQSSNAKVIRNGGESESIDLTPMAKAAGDGISAAIIMLRGDMPESMGTKDIAEAVIEYIAHREAGVPND